ncbi:lymphokine-activated killer T-cell-originated protein kinase homolog [Anopheles nili]|uniref:lymphokine-activated killer T-cell-originated protein kinase homolog n=1 Tax=Anopheles nili TaxID=185578 RepID=UPI00237BE423|nr:lymphokine-activated killer T-cell-originated protein kinase homolog [Anopheles nili]
MVTLEVLKGLAYLHNKELTLHGDLKSLNILIKNDFERVQICGFDASRILMPNGFLDLVTNPIAMYGGTALWSAPEVFFQDSRLISVKTDIFALGLVIYEMLVLVPPHTFPGMIDECVSASTMYSAKRNIVFPSSSQLNREDVIIQDFGEAERMEVFYDMGIPTNLNQDEKELPLHMVVARKRAAPRVDPDIVTIDSSDDDVKVYNQGEVLNIISDDDEDEIFSYSDSESDEDCDDEEHWESSSLSGEDVVDTDEMMESDEEDEEDGPYLNYGCLGTRPPIPSEITLGEEYATMLELFFVCTNSNKDERPSALTLLFGLKNYVPKRDPNLTGMNP